MLAHFQVVSYGVGKSLRDAHVSVAWCCISLLKYCSHLIMLSWLLAFGLIFVFASLVEDSEIPHINLCCLLVTFLLLITPLLSS